MVFEKSLARDMDQYKVMYLGKKAAMIVLQALGLEIIEFRKPSD